MDHERNRQTDRITMAIALCDFLTQMLLNL